MKKKSFKRIISIVVLEAFLLHLGGYLPAQTDKEIATQFQEAKKSFVNGTYENAKIRIERIISIIKESNISLNDILGRCSLLLGAIYEKEGKPVLAEENYRKAREEYGNILVEGVDLDTLPLYRKIVKGEGGIIEKPGNGGKKSKKFPWLLVAGGVVLVGVLVYFLVLKPQKKYRLKVELGEGVEGNPSGGTHAYKKGSKVTYSYQASPGYSGLQVTLDGLERFSNGTILMDRDHTVRVTTAANTVAFETDKDNISVPEGSTAVFKVRLSAQPRANVSAVVERISGDGDIQVTPDSQSLVFTTYDYNTYQEVRLQANEDADGQDDTAVIKISAPGSGTPGIPDITINAKEQDNDKLKIQITEPQNGTVVKGEVLIRAIVSGPNAITGVEFYIDEQRETTDRSAPFSYTWDTRTASDSWHTLKVIARDTLNKTAGDDISVLVNNSKYILTVVIGQGVTGQPEGGKTPHSAGEAVSYGYVQSEGYSDLLVQLDGTAVAPSGTIIMNSHHKLEASAQPPTDKYLLTVTIGEGVTGTPLDGATFHPGGTQISYDYSLLPGYSELDVRLDGTAVSPNGTIIMDKNHTLDAAAKEIEFIIDPQELVICEEKTETFNVKLSGRPQEEINVTVSNPGGSNSIKVIDNRLTFTPTDWSTERTVTLQAMKDTDETDDEAMIRVEAPGINVPVEVKASQYDLEKHKPPVIWFNEPRDGETVSDEVDIRAEVAPGIEVERVEFEIDNELKYTATASPYQYNWPTNAVSDGNHQIKVTAYDRCLQAGWKEITVKVTDSPPQITQFYSKKGDTVSGTAGFYVYAYDYRGVKQLRLYVKRGQEPDTAYKVAASYEGNPTSHFSHTFEVDTTAYTNGNHHFKAAAVDTAGQETQSPPILINIQN